MSNYTPDSWIESAANGMIPDTDGVREEDGLIECDCGHSGFENECATIRMRTWCVNCLLPRDIKKFWERVNKKAGDECWLWKGSTCNGYGMFKSWHFGKRILAHRFSFFIEHDRFPNPHGLHRCDVPRCVNPRHIFEGTPTDNMRDCAAKGRAVHVAVFGTQNGQSKLCPEKVIEIRRRHRQGAGLRALGREYGVSCVTIKSAVTGKNWGYVTDPVPQITFQEQATLREVTK